MPHSTNSASVIPTVPTAVPPPPPPTSAGPATSKSKFSQALDAPLLSSGFHIYRLFTIPYSQFPGGVEKPLFAASGEWEWLNKADILSHYEKLVYRNYEYTTAIRRGNAGGRDFSYLIKSWKYPLTQSPLRSRMFTELFLYMKRFGELLGTTIPRLIAVQRSPEELHFVMELPHRSFWVEASSDMPVVLKERVVQALERIHSQGILHGSIKLSNFLITGDGTVFVINFHQARSADPFEDPCINLALATPLDFRTEMRELHFKLNYKDAQNEERVRTCRHALALRSHGSAQKKDDSDNDPPIFNLSEWLCPLDALPRRFIAPDKGEFQSFEQSLKTFLDVVIKTRSSHHSVTLTEIPLESEYHNTRKRKQTSDPNKASSNNPPPKRSRVLPQGKSRLISRKHDAQKLAADLVSQISLDPSIQLNNSTPKLPFIVVRDFISSNTPTQHDGITRKHPVDSHRSVDPLPLTSSADAKGIWNHAESFLKAPFRFVGQVLDGFTSRSDGGLP